MSLMPTNKWACNSSYKGIIYDEKNYDGGATNEHFTACGLRNNYYKVFFYFFQ